MISPFLRVKKQQKNKSGRVSLSVDQKTACNCLCGLTLKTVHSLSVLAGGVARNTTALLSMENRSEGINCVRSCGALC